jgi:hypothetical protein
MSDDTENKNTDRPTTGDSKASELAEEKIEQEAEQSNHTDATKLSGAATEDLDDNTKAGTPKSINNDR